MVRRSSAVRGAGVYLVFHSCAAVTGCTPDERDVLTKDVAKSEARVEFDQRGAYYDFAFLSAPSLAELQEKFPDAGTPAVVERYERELAVQGVPYWSSAAITVPALDSSGKPYPVPAGATTTMIRYSCGATLISPSYVITAGHCVTPDTDLTQLKLHMFRPTPALTANYTPATKLSGTWPAFTHGSLSPSDGYLVDDYSCQVVRRCYSDDVACPNTNTDAALLHCDGRPGDRYGFVNVTSGTDPSGKEALMHWKHEVLALPQPIPADVQEHYVKLGLDPVDNYHYFDNQLLPLRSITWPDGTPTRFVGPEDVDVHGCHGSSGSGILARVDGTPVFELVSPAVSGGAAFGGNLCEHVPNPGGSPSGPGTSAIGTYWSTPTTWLSGDVAVMSDDCKSRQAAPRDVENLPFAAGSHHVSTLYGHLNCQISDAFHGGTASAPRVLGPYPEKYLNVAAGAPETVVTGFGLEAGADYRLGVHVVPVEACTTDCGAVLARVGTDVASLPVPGSTDPAQLTRLFPSTSAGAVEVGVASTAKRRLLGGFVLVREGQVNSFDVLEDRLEAAVYALSGANVVAGPAPMRFIGDGTASFAALLYPSERMALLRQAIAPGHTWSVRLQASSYDGLTCGLLDMKGAPVSRVPCAPFLQIDDNAGTAGRLGFYAELAATGPATGVVVRSIALASSSARDTDEDGVPEVLDNCPGDWNASQHECSEEKPEAGAPPIDGGTEAGSPEAGLPDSGDTTESGTAGSGGASSGGTPAETGGTPSSTGGTTTGGTAGASTGGTTSSSGGTSGPDASTDPPPPNHGSDSGCSCNVPNTSRSPASHLAALLVALVALRRRRTRT